MTDKQQNGSNIPGSIIKNPSAEEIKFMQWGVPQPNATPSGSQIANPKRYPYFSEMDEQNERKPGNEG